MDVNGHGINCETFLWLVVNDEVGGVSCYIREGNSNVVTQNGSEVQFWWRDSNYTRHGNATHPVGIWQKATTSISGISYNASFDLRAYREPGVPRGIGGFNRYLVTQHEDLTIRAYNITGQYENTALSTITFGSQSVPFVSVANGKTALPGSAIAFTADPGPLGKNATSRTWITWFQTVSTDISQFTASSNDLQNWKESHISITD